MWFDGLLINWAAGKIGKEGRNKIVQNEKTFGGGQDSRRSLRQKNRKKKKTFLDYFTLEIIS